MGAWRGRFRFGASPLAYFEGSKTPVNILAKQKARRLEASGNEGLPTPAFPLVILPKAKVARGLDPPAMGAELSLWRSLGAPVDLRVNRLKAAPADVAPLLPDAAPIPGLPDALRLPEGWPIEQQPVWTDGLVEVQDAGSLSGIWTEDASERLECGEWASVPSGGIIRLGPSGMNIFMAVCID